MIEHMIRDAFTQPFELSEMIRLTFITGAGKLGRAKYDENAARAMTTALRELGYQEDRGASATMDCAGTFKLQHDTGKNLKTVVVFPKVSTINGLQQAMGNAAISHDGNHNATNAVPLIEEGSIEQKLIQTPVNLFPKMVESKCETWNQKKSCTQAINKLKQLAESLDQKLMQGKPLSDSEQEYYNSVSITVLEEKLTCLRDMMTAQADSGRITTEEKKQLMEQITDRITTLSNEMSEAEIQGKAKRVENLKVQLDKAKARQTKIQSASTILPPKLKNEDAIIKLRKEQLPLLELEKAAKGRLLSIKESQSMARKDEIENEVHELELSSRQWFETDPMFEARIKVTQSNWEKHRKQQAQNATKKKASSSAASTSKMSSSSSSGTKWVLPGAKKAGAWSTSKPSTKSSQAGTTGSGLFAAMMNGDSDSD